MSRPLMCPPELFQRDLSAFTYVITGANSGIGLITARQLALQGALVILAVRNLQQGEKAAAEIREQAPQARLEVRQLDLASLDSVRAFAAEFLKEHQELHGLVNNAGVMNTPRGKTKDGFETQFGVNHLGHFLLTSLLLDCLKNSAPARIVNLSSCYHDKAMGREGKIDFDDLNFESRKYDGWQAYAQSKLANLLHAKELAVRLQGSGVTAVSVHPGWVRTQLIRNSVPVWVQNVVMRPFLGLMGMIEPWQGAQSSLYALLAPDVPEHAGEFYSQTGMYRDRSKNQGAWPMVSPNPHAHDAQVATRLWKVSEELVGLEASP